jgi:hypothetical protein
VMLDPLDVNLKYAMYAVRYITLHPTILCIRHPQKAYQKRCK